LLVETDRYFLTVDRYIHLNPVRAGLVVSPEDYRWSSYNARFHVGGNDWVDHFKILDYFGEERGGQLNKYRKFTEEAINKPEEWSLDQLRKMSCLGSARFLHEMIQREQTKKIA
jgi:hypothetical protein